MAGYIFALNNENALSEIINNGIYSTIMKIPKNNIWNVSHEGTLADYLSMKEGDNVYFFIKRKIYGIGELVNINGDCKFLNFPDADIPLIYAHRGIKSKMILNEEVQINNRFLCTFKPAPYFFNNGIDMDDVLASSPRSFRMLRAFWKLSFLKIDEEENKALKDVILKNNEDCLYNSGGTFNDDLIMHKRVSDLVDETYKLSSKKVLANCNEGVKIRHEMALEAGIIDKIANEQKNIFGLWDYISHQVIASPFKAIDYMDKMDVFGYRHIPGYDTISKYLVMEIKKDVADENVINQVMKYVDWVNQEYTYGDYSMIEAFVVAYDFSDKVIQYKKEVAVRNFVKGRRPALSIKWSNLRLIKYRFDEINQELIFEEV